MRGHTVRRLFESTVAAPDGEQSAPVADTMSRMHSHSGCSDECGRTVRQVENKAIRPRGRLAEVCPVSHRREGIGGVGVKSPAWENS